MKKTNGHAKALHTRDDVDWLYISRKEGGPALKTALTHGFNYLRTTLENTKED